ncbi:MAG: hypothetical protein HY064_14335 [Bacteroidetes bacterium]|nr:hypothetical protein [Bacteroidota bacterium]
MEKHLPPGMKNRWNPFMPKISPAMPPTLDDPFAPKPKDPVTSGGNKGTKVIPPKSKVLQNLNHLVEYKGAKVPVYRGGNSFKIRPSDIKVDPSTNLVKTTHGLSVDINPNSISKFGGAYEIKSIPDGLKIIQRGKNPEHFEIVPAYEMPEATFQSLLDKIKTEFKK